MTGLRKVGIFIQENVGLESSLNQFYFLRLFSSQTFSCINILTFLKFSHSSYLPANEDGAECSETSAYKIHTPGNYPEESIQQVNNLSTIFSPFNKL